jgi:SSS family solute:Na+ symporter
MAAKNVESARQAPLLAAFVRIFLPFLLILPGALAVGLPTPHSSTVVRNDNGVIYHETTVVPRAAEEGQGLVPARLDPATGEPLRTAAGPAQLDYSLSTPNLFLHFLPTGLLGLALTALLACLMSGVAASATAFNTVFTCDLYQSHIRKGARDQHYLAVGRWAAVGGMLLSAAAACAVTGFHGISAGSVICALLLVFSLVNAPLFATVLLGMFSKRATGHGAFAGLLAGTGAALLHHGLTLPLGAHPGMRGGWIAVLHNSPGDIAQSFWTALLAFSVNLIVASVVSLCTQARPRAELAGLVHSLTPRPRRAKAVWWKRPGALALWILLAALALNVYFA